MQILLLALALPVLLVAVQFVLGPPLLLGTLRAPDRAGFRPAEPGELPAKTAARFRTCEEHLAAEGFERVAHLFASGSAAQRQYVALLVNRATGESAVVADLRVAGEGGGRELRSAGVEFSTVFADGLVIDTNNHPQVGIFRDDPRQIVSRFPGVREPRRLLALHRALLRRHGPAGEAPVLPAPGGEVEHLNEAVPRQWLKQVEYGLAWHDREGGAFRPTGLGAVLFAWKLAWPVGAIRTRRMHRRAAVVAAGLAPELAADAAAIPMHA